MIVDKIENASLYFELSEGIKKGLTYLQNTDFSKLEKGKYILDGDKVYAMVNEYESKPADACKLESHLKYIDIQFIFGGVEQMGYVPKTNQKTSIAYNPEKDVQFYEEDVTFIPFTKGQFAIFYPTDLHQPGVILNKASIVRKVVVKVAV